MELAGLDAFFTTPQDQEAGDRWGRLFAGLPEIVRVKVWDRTATVLWSDEPHLIGQRFPENEELQTAPAGRIAVEIHEQSKTENA